MLTVSPGMIFATSIVNTFGRFCSIREALLPSLFAPYVSDTPKTLYHYTPISASKVPTIFSLPYPHSLLGYVTSKLREAPLMK